MDKLNQVVIFKLGETTYGVDLNQVKEIINVTGITKLPNTPVFVEGIANLRGSVYTIIDLRTKFGIEKKAYDANTKIIIANQKNAGVLVDEISQIMHIEDNDICTLDDSTIDLGHAGITCFVKKDDDIVVVLDLYELINFEQTGQV